MRKIYLLFIIFCSITNLFGQTNVWYILAEKPTKTLTVDTENNPSDGSEGSWYKWEINNNASILGTGDDPDGPNQNDNNEALITWNATFPTSYTPNNTLELIKYYSITATEYNNCDDTNGSTTTTEVKLVKLDILQIDLDTNICNDNEGNITIYGTPEAVVTLNLTGGELVNQNPITIGNDGKVDVAVRPTTNSTEIWIQIAEIRLTKDNPFNQTFSEGKSNGFSFDTANLKIAVGKSPVISPIMF